MIKHPRQIVFWFLLLCLTLGGFPPVLAATQEAMYRDAREAYDSFTNTKNAFKFRHNWMKVIRKYEKVIKNYPSGTPTENAFLAIGDLYLGLYRYSRSSSDLEGALGGYRSLTQKFSKSAYAAKAQLKIGEIFFKYKKDLDKAYVELLKVELNHPDSKEEVARARKLMGEISGNTGLDVSELIKKPPPKVQPPAINPEAKVEPKAAPAVIRGIRYWPDKNYSRLAIDMTRQVKFKEHLLREDDQLGKPMRIYLDLSPASVSANVEEEHPIRDGLLRQVRVGQYDQETVRLVLDIEHIQSYRVFSLNDPFRIVIDVMGDKSPEGIRRKVLAKVQQKTSTTPSPANGKAEPAAPLKDLRKTALKRKKVPRGPARTDYKQASLARQLGLGIQRVVIDPGHGGKDNGATGITGLKEKDLVLRVAKSLGSKIKKQLGLEVLLTRNGDDFLPLEERTAYANTKGADLFISIHANAHKSAKVHGIETYFLNLATDDDAMRVAARENATTRKNMSDLQMILSDLMLNSKITESGRLGSKVHKSIVTHVQKKYKIRDLGVKQAPFYVLIGANMPSILVEIGFISNQVEEKRLKSNDYINHITDGILEGIKQYNASIKGVG